MGNRVSPTDDKGYLRRKMIGEYRARQRAWIMEYLPDMPEPQWKEYEKWVAAYSCRTKKSVRRNVRRGKSASGAAV